MSPHTHIVVCAERLAPDGHGIATSEETSGEIWVPDLLPGECALVEIVHQSPHKARARAWAQIQERVGPLSPSRVTAMCPAHGTCGGCAWQHLDQDGQLEQKRLHVERALRDALDAPPTVPLPIAGSATGYRNKGKYVVARDGDAVVLGAYKPRTHDVVSTLGCRVVQPIIDQVAAHIADRATALRIPVYSEGAGKSIGLRYVIIRSNKQRQALVLLVCTSDTASQDLHDLAHELAAVEAVEGVLRCNNDLRSGGLLSNDITRLCGNASISENAAGISIPLGPAAFWQLNRNQAERAYADLAAAITPAARVVELYCGVGAISFALAATGAHVLGIERDSASVDIATKAAKAAGLAERLQFLCADATNLDASLLADADAIIVDPPRKGLGERGTAQLIAAWPSAIAYLSCNPESLARDLAALVAAGYSIESIQLYDFMPGTSQVESLVLLRQG